MVSTTLGGDDTPFCPHCGEGCSCVESKICECPCSECDCEEGECEECTCGEDIGEVTNT